MSEPFDWSEWGGEISDAATFSFNETGDKIVGKVTFLQVLDTKYGKRPMMILETEDGDRKVWASSAGLQRALAEQKPQIGDKVRIIFDHEEDTGGGNPLKVFDVAVKRAVKAVEEETF